MAFKDLKQLFLKATPGTWAAEDAGEEFDDVTEAQDALLEFFGEARQAALLGTWRIICGDRVVAENLKKDDAEFIACAYNTLSTARGE